MKSAAGIYNKILEKRPGIPSPHMMLGTIYDKEQLHEKAASHYRKALEINPDFAPAANNLAYHLSEREKNYDETLKYARKAKAILPEDPSVMDTLGLVYFRKGLYGNAVEEFKDCLEIIPDNPLVHYHLGITYAKKGDKKLAVLALSKALEINRNFKGAEKAEAILADMN